jgi:hypothetical protein
MRAFTAMFAALCAMAAPMQAHALTFCDDVKDDHDRMTCLQEHISHLEETIVALGGRIAVLETALSGLLSADATYRMKWGTQDKCLGLTGDGKSLAVVGCDNPSSWVLLPGPPIKPPKKPAATSSESTSNETSGQASARSVGAASQSKGNNPCRGLDQPSCEAKADNCQWKPDKVKCVRK